MEKKVNLKNSAEAAERLPIVSLVTGIAIAYAITCVVIITYALLLTYTSITEKHIPLVVIITCIFSVLVAGFDTAKGAKEKGWLWGMVAGLIYAFILIAIEAFVVKSFLINTNTITLIIISVAGGGLGGMLGINIKK